MAKRRDDYDDYYESWYPQSRPIRRDDGIRSRTERGAFASSWWAKRWLQVLESYGLGSRLQRGRSYARGGQVLNIEFSPGQVKAKVQGSRPKPYNVKLEMKTLTNAEWEHVIDTISGQAIFAAQLLSGEMPQEIEQAFAAANISLFPERGQDIITECSCPDLANPCKHIAAVYYLIGEQFDVDPFLIFTLRGRTREQVIEALRARRAAAIGEETGDVPTLFIEPTPSLQEQITHFWQPKGEPIRVSFTPPEVELAVLRRLGTSPEGTDKELRALYQAIRDYAQVKLFGEQRGKE
jgi:uncharacterized Zn finger protein